MSGPNPNKQPVELNRTSLFWGYLQSLYLQYYSQAISSTKEYIWNIAIAKKIIKTTALAGFIKYQIRRKKSYG